LRLIGRKFIWVRLVHGVPFKREDKLEAGSACTFSAGAHSPPILIRCPNAARIP
jgi:hypothetical protein